MSALLTITGYMVQRTIDGVIHWSVTARNVVICPPTSSLPFAIAAAQRAFGRVAVCVWDADRGEFASELVCDANY